jgi:polyisoprenoid-binding protein YceI
VARYRIIPDQSRVWVDGRSSVHPIHSSTEGLEGYIELEMDSDGHLETGSNPAATLSLPVSRLSSGNRMEDREMQKRIDARRFPTIEGVLDRMDRSGEDGSYRVSGEVTFRGVARHHEDEMTVEAVDDRTIKLAGTSRFDIREFGMEPPRILMLKVAPEVDVRVEIIAEKEG